MLFVIIMRISTYKKSIEEGNEEWYVRLTIEAPDEGMIDKNNVLGVRFEPWHIKVKSISANS